MKRSIVMSERMAFNNRVSNAPSSTTSMLQRQCATCGNHTITGGECPGCQKKSRGFLQRKPMSGDYDTDPSPETVEVLNSAGQPPLSQARALAKPRLNHDFSGLRTWSIAPPKIDTFYSGKTNCSPTWYGDTSPEVDPSGSSFTGKLIVKY